MPVNATDGSEDMRGIYDKFTVTRNDHDPRHKDCAYFVLDLTHDPVAREAARAYVRALIATGERAALAYDLASLTADCEKGYQGMPCKGPKCGGTGRVHVLVGLCDECEGR